MKVFIAGFCFLIITSCIACLSQKDSASATNNNKSEREIINLSKDKWRWMADKKVDTLDALFHTDAVFVHMGGTMNKEQELTTIKEGRIHYKRADIHEVSVQRIGNTAIVLSKIHLLAVVGGTEVTNPFVVTEVYIRQDGKWQLGSMSFTRLLGE